MERKLIKTYYVIKFSDGWYFRDFGLIVDCRSGAKKFDSKEQAIFALKDKKEAKLVYVKVYKKELSTKTYLSKMHTILNETNSLKTLSQQVVDSFFAGESESNKDRFYDKIIALNNKLLSIKVDKAKKFLDTL